MKQKKVTNRKDLTIIDSETNTPITYKDRLGNPITDRNYALGINPAPNSWVALAKNLITKFTKETSKTGLGLKTNIKSFTLPTNNFDEKLEKAHKWGNELITGNYSIAPSSSNTEKDIQIVSPKYLDEQEKINKDWYNIVQEKNEEIEALKEELKTSWYTKIWNKFKRETV